MWKRFFCLTLLLSVFTACGPRYVIRSSYIPPEGPGAAQCLSICAEHFKRCQRDCLRQKEACLERVRREAKDLYLKLSSLYLVSLKDYDQRVRLYQTNLLSWEHHYRQGYEDYRFFEQACQKEKNVYACKRKQELAKLLKDMEKERPKRPLKPKVPSLARILRELSRTCTFSCGCQEIYKACFLKCGGRIVPYKFCLKNCSQN